MYVGSTGEDVGLKVLRGWPNVGQPDMSYAGTTLPYLSRLENG